MALELRKKRSAYQGNYHLKSRKSEREYVAPVLDTTKQASLELEVEPEDRPTGDPLLKYEVTKEDEDKN
jgi:hypothetical protein